MTNEQTVKKEKICYQQQYTSHFFMLLNEIQLVCDIIKRRVLGNNSKVVDIKLQDTLNTAM